MSDNREVDTASAPASQQPTPQGQPATREWNAPWVGGLILILIGSAFLLQNLTGFWFENWWAIFIAIPGVFALMAAWRLYEGNGRRFTGQVATAAMGAVFPLLVAAIFLFHLDWGEVWPLFLIAAGVVALLPRALERQQ